METQQIIQSLSYVTWVLLGSLALGSFALAWLLRGKALGRVQGGPAIDALNRRESCGGHFREESRTPEGEALRDDENYAYVAAWEFQGVGEEPTLHKEQLVFENVELAQRSYK